MKIFCTLLCFSWLGIVSFGKESLDFQKGDLCISVEAGENWLHDFPLLMGIKVKNAPQFAIWITDLDSNYISTVYCTHKIASEGWRFNKGNRRKEALPFWAHRRGVKEADGLFLPTKKRPFTDAVTGATPKDDYTFRLIPTISSRFLLFAEFNHSTDFNDAYPKHAAESTPGYSGGKEGSGQPALVYCAEIDLTADRKEWVLQLIGHASPDGTDGKLYTDMQGITTAASIVRRVTVTRIP